MTFTDVLFYITAVLLLFSAWRAVSSPLIFRSALYLACSLALTAVLYVLLHAEFVATIQILVYVGAVIILIIFAVMLTAQLGEKLRQSNGLVFGALLLSSGLAWVLVRAIREQTFTATGPALPNELGNTQQVGQAILNTYTLPFEVVGLLLFAALVGAVVIARKDPET